MADDEQTQIRQDFADAVNMNPADLERWLGTEESRNVGQSEGGESVGHASGRRIIALLRKKISELDEDDYGHMRKVIGYIHRHLAPRPDGDVSGTRWRYSLMNWGHDPLAD